MMRLPAVLCASGLAGLLIAPVAAQPSLPSLPSRAPATESPVVAPDTAPPVPEWWKNGGPRVRTPDTRIAALLKSGLERSPRLRNIVDQIDAANTVVYVAIDPTMKKKGLAGRLTFAGSAGNYRYLRALINPDMASEQIIASIAHELHHVLEVIANPEVRNENDLEYLYKRIGRQSRAMAGSGWETDAARQVGDDVRRELVLGRGHTVARREAEPKGAVR
jgi:hypothetical protein